MLGATVQSVNLSDTEEKPGIRVEVVCAKVVSIAIRASDLLTVDGRFIHHCCGSWRR